MTESCDEQTALKSLIPEASLDQTHSSLSLLKANLQQLSFFVRMTKE